MAVDLLGKVIRCIVLLLKVITPMLMVVCEEKGM